MEPNTPEPGANLTMPMVIGGAVIAALVLGGLYFWPHSDTTLSATSDVDSESWMPKTGGTDETASILAELEATDMAEFESTMNADAEAAVSEI